jgi:hypothetical protein
LLNKMQVSHREVINELSEVLDLLSMIRLVLWFLLIESGSIVSGSCLSSWFSCFTLVPSNGKPSDVVVSIREFIGNFFLCEECATHFVNMTFNAESEINSFEESVLYLWRSKANNSLVSPYT